MQIQFQNHEFAFQFLRVVGAASSRQSEPGECFATAKRITDGDFESWTREWSRTAERLAAAAGACLREGRRVSASDTYLRAANYFRAAEFFLHGDPRDPRILELAGKSARCFELGLAGSELSYTLSRVPYEGTTLPGIFYSGGPGARPTLIATTGYDGTIDGMLPIARAATRRGWNCFTFEGPGQGLVIRQQNLPFRPDWERVITPVFDHLGSLSGVDTKRIALLGTSFGGYLAPRAAAFEHRLAACVANGGVFDFLGSRVPAGMTRAQFGELVRTKPEQINATLAAQAARDPGARWSQQNGMYTFHAATPAEWLAKVLDYNLEGVAAQIRCPTLIVDVEAEHAFPGQAKRLFDALTCPKSWVSFSDDEGAGDHCQTGSPMLGQQRIFDWLEETVR